jgi:hypothetical protein
MTRSKRYYQELDQKYGHLSDRCVCKLCGRTYKNLGGHIRHHGFTANSYKDHFEIMRTTPLVAPDLSLIFSDNAKRLIEEGLLAQDIQELGKKQKGKRPVITLATRKYRRTHINIKISSERRSEVANNMYFKKPEIKDKISRTLKIFYAPLATIRKCDNCGKPVRKAPSKIKEHCFCNKACFGEWSSKRSRRKTRT